MRIVIGQISEKKNKKRIYGGLPTLLYKQYNKGTFDIYNYMVVHVNFKYQDIPYEMHKVVLNTIEKEFESFYTFTDRETPKIIPSDIVKIGRYLYYYNGDGVWVEIHQ